MKDKKEKIASLSNYSRFVKTICPLLKGEGWVRITLSNLAELFEEDSGNKIARITVSSYLKQMEKADLIQIRFVDGSHKKQEICLNEDK